MGAGLLEQVIDLVGDEVRTPAARASLRARLIRPLMLLVFWELLPWVVGAWAVATLCSSLATTAALRVFFSPVANNYVSIV